ncbi:hypothetical protein K227x_08520 [Rubripirellula lacrimiformis]|uniref:Uncharacterized protein n=1 Tax=Rubripirellula lacrimiformis TaxID=1930273 RepID=A0A517N5R3_9BACT|nr:hypothetical protein [Rubripirellula lacrimiformis]QDT02475.1 hypothetical protein K227x_08520 [Rubripirellula lacrimiformis]
MRGIQNKLTSVAFAACLLVVATTVGVGQSPPGESDVQSFLATAGGGPQMGVAGDMIGFSSSDASGTQTITLVHTGKSWMAVYHIDRSGKIRLVSSRPIDADFSLQLNATSPLPEEIRQMGRR